MYKFVQPIYTLVNRYILADSAELIQSGDPFFKETVRIIDEAKEIIHLQTYIFADDETGRTVADALIKAANRGVKIWMLIDGYGSKELSKAFVQKFIDAGIRFRFFGKLFSGESVSAMRRLHHKILVADQQEMLIGGINIGDKYHGTAKEQAWLDYAVLIKGDCCRMIHRFCEMMYDKKIYNWEKVHLKQPANGVQVRFRLNDWVRGKRQVYSGYKYAVKNADSSITIVGTYFQPGFRFLKLLKAAVKRGVRVRVMMGSISDIPMFHHAETWLYDYLFRNGIEVFEWNESVLHGKAAVVDEEWSTVGSYNLNNLSKYKTIELNVDIKNAEFSKNFNQHLTTIFEEKCRCVKKEEYLKKTNIFTRFRNWIAYSYYRLFMVLISSRE